jgi:hypothetical protein
LPAVCAHAAASAIICCGNRTPKRRAPLMLDRFGSDTENCSFTLSRNATTTSCFDAYIAFCAAASDVRSRISSSKPSFTSRTLLTVNPLPGRSTT